MSNFAPKTYELNREYRRYVPMVYICSPFRGDAEGNVMRAKRFCHFAVTQGCMPIAPHLLFPQFMDDNDREERELALLFGRILIPKCEQLWVFGEPSEGMADEIEKAKRSRRKIKYFNNECQEVDCFGRPKD